MRNRIREIRKAKGLTLDQVAQACKPPTTAQTLGRLETGTRTLSIDWVNRIATALGVSSADLVETSGQAFIPVAATVDAQGAHPLTAPARLAVPQIQTAMVGIRVNTSIGDYRSGDELWCVQLPPERFGLAINRDILVPRPGGRFLFGRMVAQDGTRMQLLPPVPGGRQQVVNDAPWIAMATRLIRSL